MFKDLLDKGKNFVEENTQKLLDKKEEHDAQMKVFNALIDKKNKLELTEQVSVNNPHVQDFNIEKVLKMASSSIK